MRYQRNIRFSLGLIAMLFSLLFSFALNVFSQGGVIAQQAASLSSAVGGENRDNLGQWTSHGPYGGPISSLAIDRGNPLIVYAGTPSGVFKSNNGGASWAISLTNTRVQIVAIAPATPTTLYAAGRGIYKSIDGGTSWNAVNNGLENQSGPIEILALTIDPTNSNIVYVAGPDITDSSGLCCFKAIYKSTDGGGSWSITKHSINSFAVHHALAIDPLHTNIIYAAGSVGNGTVWKSTDNGKFWTIVNVGLDSRSTVFAMAINPTNTNIIYVATETLGVYKSTDGGESWSAFNNGLPYYYTDDNGQHYFSRVSSITIDPLDPSLIYAGTYGGVFKNSNGGSWSALNGGLTNLGVNALAIDPANTNSFYTGTPSGIFKTANGGANWSAANNGLHNVVVAAVTIDPANANKLYSRTDIFDTNIAYASADNGASWAEIGFYPLAFDPHNSNIIYAFFSQTYELKKSTDGGVTWIVAEKGMENSGVLEVLIDPNNPNVLLAGTYSGVFRSTDAGASWSVVSTQFYPLGLVMDPKNSLILYAFTLYDDCFSQTYLTFKSTDGGVTWTNGPEFYLISSLAVDPVNTMTVYIGGCRAEGCGIFRSDNGGGNWNLVSNGLPAKGPSSLVIDPLRPETLYAGTYDSGVFKSTDRGATWNPLNSGLTIFNINVLALDATGNFLHAGTPAGVFDYQIGIPCVYSTSAAGQTFPAAGGTANVNVTATGGCNWQATNSPAWVTFSSPNGTGDGVVALSVAANASPFPRSAVLNIAGRAFTVNQSGAAPINAIDATEFFVQQHYVDFLNRQADAAGLSFWKDSIHTCGFDTQCFELKRINASAAFFLSIEFQQTGYLVYRTYKTAYGNLPNAPVPLKLNEFLPDTQQIGQGVIVNQAGWEQLLENNKQNFFSDFVQRSRFASSYPISLTPDQFVDQLFTNAGVTPSATDRAAAINEFGLTSNTSDAAARARALRRIAENSTLAQQEFKRAFVLMQYFGYLRRNPNDAPELGLNFDGYNFWLNKLNQFNGNFINAEMVKAFLVSTEYRQRFGQP
jgi:photosystem II stability/assembly factor-like uncharacterized protein